MDESGQRASGGTGRALERKDILQEGSRGDGTRTRWTFTDITADSFHWRGEALYPRQETWTLEAEFRATRRRP
jgi:hypothetical protein